MPKRFDENLTRSFVAVALLFALFCRSGESNAQGFSLSDTPQPASGPSIDKVTTNLEEIIQLPNGTIYQGPMGRDGKPHGKGTLIQPTGTILHGEWRDGNPYKLSGTTVYPDGTREVGTWNYDGSKSDGTITWRDGRIYKGPWKFVEGLPDRPDGQGEMTWPDGRKYVGQFRDGMSDGLGKLTYPDGHVEDGSWKRDKFMGAAH